MTKGQFEELKNKYRSVVKKEDMCTKVANLWSDVSCKLDLTREEISELMDILFIPDCD